MMLAVNLTYMAFIMLLYVTSKPTLLRVFTINVCSVLSNAFPVSTEIIIQYIIFIILHFVSMVYHVDLFEDVEPYLDLWNKSHFYHGV